MILELPSGRHGQQKEGVPTVHGKSDQFIVLGGRASRLQGEGIDGIRSLQRKHRPDMQGRRNGANLPAGNSKQGKG